MKLQNTINVPNQFAAQGINHVAIYQDGAVSTYQKSKPFAKMELTGPTYSITGVRQIRISPSGEYIAVQTKTKTVRLHNGVQENFDNNVGAFSIADTGQIVMIALASGAVQVIDSSVTNLTVAVTDDDRVVCAKGRYMVYNRARTIISAYDNLVLSPVASAKEIVWATHDHNGKFVVFYSDGTFSYDGAAAKALAVPNLLGFRDAGDQILATDKKKDWCVNHFRPLAFPEQVRAFKWTLPPTYNDDYSELLLMAPGSGITTADFDLKNGLAVSSSNALTSVADAPYGATGKSWLFNGTTSRLQTADSTDIQLGANDFTLEMFVKVDPATTAVSTVVQKGGGLNVSWSSFLIQAIAATKTFTFSASFNNTQIDVGTSDGNGWGSFEFDVWTHIAITRKGNKWRCFQDGKLCVTYTASGTVFANATRGIQFGHSRATNFNSGTLYGQFKGNINGFQILNYAKYTHDFYPETLTPSLALYSPPIAAAPTVLTGTMSSVSMGFSNPSLFASANRMILPTTDKIRIVEADLTITETNPPAIQPYPNFSLIDDTIVTLGAINSAAYLSVDGGQTFTQTLPGGNYGGVAYKMLGSIWMAVSQSTAGRKYSLDMSSFVPVTKVANLISALGYWDVSGNAVISTSNQSGDTALYVGRSTTDMSMGGYGASVSTNCDITYIGSNVFYVRNNTGSIAKLFYVGPTGGPVLVGTMPIFAASVMHIGSKIIVLFGNNIYKGFSRGADNSNATLADAKEYALGIIDACSKNVQALGFSATWAAPWKGQNRFVIGNSTAYRIYDAS